jgi:predicted MPP superfamily phosphohydrolase
VLSIERFVVAATVAAVVLVLAASACVRRLARCLRGRGADANAFSRDVRPTTPIGRWTDRLAIVLGAAVVGAVAYGHWEPYWPEVVRVTVRLPKLRQPIRLVQLSDLHSDPTVRTERSLPAIVAGLAPDLIVFTGDAINSNGGLDSFRQLMTDLAAIAPTFAVRGNWDVWWFPHANLFGSTGVRELTAQAAGVRVRDQDLWVVGVPVDSEAALPRAIAAAPADRPVILLHHYAMAFDLPAARRADLTLVGDSHGGQMRLPGLGELIRLARHGVWKAAGLHREGNRTLYVNRGIGMEGGLPRVRFRCRPEITLLDLAPE